MKPNRLFACTAALAVLAIASSCTGQDQTLKFRPEAGDSRSVVLEQETAVEMSMMGQKFDTHNSTTQRLTFDVENVSPEGVADIQVTINRSQIAISSAFLGQLAAMSGGAIPPDLGTAKANEALQALEGKTFRMKVANSGEIVEVSELENLQTEIQTEEPMEVEAMERANAMFSEDQIKEQLGQLFINAPDKPLSVGESWTSSGAKEVAASGMPYDYSETFNVTDWQDTRGVMSIDSTFDASYTADQAREAMGMADTPGLEMLDMTMTMNGTGTGTATVDRPSGWLTVREETGTVNGNMEMGMAGQNFSMPMTIEIKSRMETFPQ